MAVETLKDIEIIANLSKYSEPLKEIMKDKKLWGTLIKEFQQENLSDSERKLLDEIFRNATKNSFNAEKIASLTLSLVGRI